MDKRKVFAKRNAAPLAATIVGVLLAFATSALAHGERAQEPSLRLSTIQWYDTRWSADHVNVNHDLTVSGRFHVMASWPLEIPTPDRLTFLNVGIPGPVFIRTSSFIDGVNGVASMPLELGKDYEYKFTLRGRIPGRYHVHPMLDVQDAGAIIGPGNWVTVEGDASAFKDPVTTLTGLKLDLSRYGLAAVVRWHLVWVVLAIAWLGYWLRKPLLIPRYEAVQAGEGDHLITRKDRIAAAIVLATTLVVAIVGFTITNMEYPVTIPLQSNHTKVPALDYSPANISITPEQVTYLVPGRSVQLRLRIANHGAKPVRIGEFTTANLRFLDSSVEKPEAGYPEDLIAPAGLLVRPDEPIAPGQTTQVDIEATSSVWETDRLTSLVSDPTSRIGGLFMFFSPDGERSTVEFSSAIIPTFTDRVRDGE
jgi:methane/ammonia monooxygenase subunit B